MIEIGGEIRIPEEELEFKASRSAGPGGQNVNKLNTKVTLSFDVANSGRLTDSQKQRILNRLRARVSKQGVLRVVSQANRTQAANRKAALERFMALMEEALRRRKPRKKTVVPTAQKRRRLEEKRHLSRLKSLRSRSDWDG